MTFTLCLTCTVHRIHIARMENKTKLAEWMAANRLTDAAMAALVECSRSMITKLRLGKAQPSLRLVERIFAVTNGAVTANDFMPDASPPFAQPSGGRAGPALGTNEARKISSAASLIV